MLKKRGFDEAFDQKYMFEFTIPWSQFPGNELYVEFRVDFGDVSGTVASAGIDDFFVTANFDCE